MIHDHELTLARRVAGRVGSRWTAVDVEDLAGELILWLYTHADTVKRYRGEDGGDGKLFVALKRTAARYCVKEQENRTGGPLELSAAYSVEQIERALPYIFETIPDTVIAEHYGRPVDPIPAEFNRAHAVLIDVRGAYDELPPEQRAVLSLRFRDGLTYADIGALAGVTDRGARRRVSRALVRLQDALGTAE